MWRRWGETYNFLLTFIDKLWKPQKIRILKKWKKKIAQDIIILHMRTKSYNHMRYSSWDTKNEKMKISEKFKKPHGDTIMLHNCTKNNDHRLYCSWDMACDRCNCYFSFWAIFDPFTPVKAQKMKLLKKWKNTWRYHFTQVYLKFWLDDVQFLRYGARQMDGQTDRQKKWHIEVGAPLKIFV